MSIPDHIKRLHTTQERLNGARQNLTPPTEWVSEAEQVAGYILGYTARYAPVMGALEAARRQIDALRGFLTEVERAVEAAIAHHTGQMATSTPSTSGPPPWVANIHGDRYPDRVNPYHDALPVRVVRGKKMQIVGLVQLDGRDFGAITATRSDSWADSVARRLAELGGNMNLFNHVEMKTVAMMLETGAKHGQVIMNHAPCGSERGHPPGCEQALPSFIPAGRSLTVLGTDAQGNPFERTYHGEGTR
ncbi:DddA-like double-stranded DNA deaminase toxin [Actinokineospora cianjurensis]|uniref:Nucleic acid/nucleotide deaminase of polymorphic system toxin n=1 Tax=Actinokineospora cianjurensis TaxID=585224 RepID=A0A421B6S2_9PSEU|nr:DddA-like double-stranded DNA deaminase toxin [Actinokineospora cianjurensis]RLK60074.1 nucleic acid/nucleotide deaminase of polymorphic system toxin [Actinokineospora cianjurensis]